MTNTEFILIGSRQKLNTGPNCLSRSEHQWYSRKPGINVKISRCTHWCKPYLGQSYRYVGWKNCLWYCSYKTGQAICSPCNIASYLQSFDSVTFRLLQCCLGNLWHKTSRQTSKTPKSCSASSNSQAMTQMHRSCSKILIGKNLISTHREIQKALMVFKSPNGLAPEYLSPKFIARSNTTSYTFRDSVNKLTIRQPRTYYRRVAFATVVLFCRIVFLKL